MSSSANIDQLVIVTKLVIYPGLLASIGSDSNIIMPSLL